MIKHAYLSLSLLEIIKILKHEFWYEYVRPKYGENTRLCYIVQMVALYGCR